MPTIGALKVPQTTGELRAYLDTHPKLWGGLVAFAGAATAFFAWRSTRTKKDKAMVRNGMAMAIMGLEVWGLVQLRRGAPIAVIADPPASPPASPTGSVDSGPS